MNKPKHLGRLSASWRQFMAVFFCLIGIGSASAAFSLEGARLTTGSGETLLSLSEQLHPAMPAGSFLQFRFAFGTDEAPTPGEFKDSFSIFLATDNPVENGLLLTADIFGVHWLGENPGGIPLSFDIFQSPAAEVPEGLGEFNTSFAFNLNASLPQDFIDKPFTLRLDLFDNQSGGSSAGFIDQIAVVPEPSGMAVVFLFLAGTFIARKFRK